MSDLELPIMCDWTAPLMQIMGDVPFESSSVGCGARYGGVACFHDGDDRELSLQLANNRLVLQTDHYAGSYLSLAIDVPSKIAQNTGKHHIFGLQAGVITSASIVPHARINIQNGPNLDTQIVQLERDGDVFRAEFDLGFMDINVQRISAIWLDLLIEPDADLTFDLRNCVVFRRLRSML